MAVIEFREVPILYSDGQRYVTESSGIIFLQLVLLLGGVDRSEAPNPVFWQRLADRLPVAIPFPIPVDRAVGFQCFRDANDIVMLTLLGFRDLDGMIPKGGGLNRDDIAPELRHVCRCSHGFSENLMIAHPTDSQHADDKRHLRGGQIFSNVANELGQQVRIEVVFPRFVRARISCPIN